MAITLRADNRAIVKDGKYSYLLDNYSSGSTSVSIMNTEGFFHNSFVLIGNIGSENTEILQLNKVDANTGELTFQNFSATAVGGGINGVAINNPGTGYEVGQILTVIQTGGNNGKVRVESVDSFGAITGLFVDQNEKGYGYSVANGVETTGGGDNNATINILSIFAASNSTTIFFETGKYFVAGQPVEIFNRSTGESRGTGVVSVSSNQTENIMTLTSPGISGVLPGDLVVVGNMTRFPHSESTRITVLQYDSIRFFRTETPNVPNLVEKTTLSHKQNTFITQTTRETINKPNTTVYTKTDDPSYIKEIDFTPPIVFEGATAISEPMPIQVNDFFTTYFDKINGEGYGWFAFLNSFSSSYSPISNPIPYAGFPENTVKKVFETFDSSMNTKELQLISLMDRYNWLNEGLSIITNELNLGNWEYFSSDEIVLNIKSGVSKYLLPEDFSDMIYMNDSKNRKIESFSPSHEKILFGVPRYSIRGKSIVFEPAPPDDGYVTFSYLKSAPTLKNLDDVVDLPNNAYYSLKDYMRFRAYQKLSDANESSTAYLLFTKQIEGMKIHASKRDKALDSFTIDRYSNV